MRFRYLLVLLATCTGLSYADEESIVIKYERTATVNIGKHILANKQGKIVTLNGLSPRIAKAVINYEDGESEGVMYAAGRMDTLYVGGHNKNVNGELLKALKASGINYTQKTSGSITSTFSIDGDDVVVYVSPTTEFLGSFEVREIYAFYGNIKTRLSEGFANDLLEVNSLKKLGDWQLMENDDKTYSLVYDAKVPAFLPGDQLKSIMRMIANIVAEERQKHAAKN